MIYTEKIKMNIHIVSAVGKGRTLLSAFDHALQKAGVCNYNLITLSSIIPPNSQVIITKRYVTPVEEFGYKLYVIKAEMRSEKKDEYITAGIGWYQLDDGRGFFVEHEFKGESKTSVQSAIKTRIIHSLGDLCRFRKVPFNESRINSSIATARVIDDPTCALVLAVYKSESWKVIDERVK